MDRKYIDYALTDSKNKQYEAEFKHPQNDNLKVGCKYSYSLSDIDYYIYHEYLNEHCYYGEASVSRTHAIEMVAHFLEPFD